MKMSRRIEEECVLTCTFGGDGDIGRENTSVAKKKVPIGNEIA